MKKYLFILLLALLFPAAMYAQFTMSFEGNGQWITEEEKTGIIPGGSESDSAKLRSNAYLKLGYAISDWDFGIQLESYYPKPLLNYSPELHDVNVGTLHVRYNNPKWGLDVTGGHIYEQFGSGLIFRTWEDRQLGINNSIFGGRINYAPVNGAKLTVLGGKQRIGMGFDFADGVVYGSDLNISFSELFAMNSLDLGVGFSFVGSYNDVADSTGLPTMRNAFAGRFNFGMGGFYLNGEFVYKDKDAFVEKDMTFGDILVYPESVNAGSALLLNVGYTQKGFGVDINLRRTENMGFYSQYDLTGNEYNTGVLNYLPALTKQYDHSLQNIYIYQAQPYLQFLPVEETGEIGGQIDVFYDFKRGSLLGGKYGTNVAFNASYWGSLRGDYDYGTRTVNADFFAVSEKLYHDVGIEVRKRVSKDLSLILSYLNQYYNLSIMDKQGVVRTNVVAGEATYKFGKAQSIKLEAQHHWADNDYKNWVGGTLEYVLNYNWSFFVNDIYNYGNIYKEERTHYYNAGVTYVNGATRVAASYGKQRGGLLCVGGVCRTVSPSTGLTLNISTSF